MLFIELLFLVGVVVLLAIISGVFKDAKTKCDRINCESDYVPTKTFYNGMAL